MRTNKYNTPWVDPVALGGETGSRQYPMLYFRLQSEIDRECDGLENRGIRRLSPQTVNDSVNRINNNVRTKYPTLAAYADEYEKTLPNTSIDLRAYGINAQFFGAFLGLIALLFLAEWVGRRRYAARRYYERRH